MGNFTGVIINKVNGGLVRDTDTSDRIILLVVGGSEIGKLEYYKPENLNDITDLEALGWDDTIDLETRNWCITIPAKSSACLRNVRCILCWFRSLKSVKPADEGRFRQCGTYHQRSKHHRYLLTDCGRNNHSSRTRGTEDGQ